jgi:hypothetical protein
MDKSLDVMNVSNVGRSNDIENNETQTQVSSYIKDRPSCVFCLKDISCILKGAYRFHSFKFTCHSKLDFDVSIFFREAASKHWHLFSSESSFVKGSSKKT